VRLGGMAPTQEGVRSTLRDKLPRQSSERRGAR